MAELFNSSFQDAQKPKAGAVDSELDNFLMMEKQKAQFTAQVNIIYQIIFQQQRKLRHLITYVFFFVTDSRV